MSKRTRILISLALVALVIYFADWKAIWTVLREVRPSWIACALLLAIADRVILNYRFEMLLHALGVRVGFARLFRMQLAANFLGSFLPGFIGVDAVRIAALCRAGEPTAPVVAATLVDRATIAIATLLFGCLMVILLAGARVPPHIANFVYLLSGITVACGLIGLHPAVRRRALRTLLRFVPGRARRMFSGVSEAAAHYARSPRLIVGVTAATAAMFLVRILFAKAVAAACGVQLPIGDLLLVIPILWIIVMLPITIGGLGVQDAGYVVVMALVGVSAPVAVSMSIIEHILVRVASFPGAFFIGDVTSRTERLTVPGAGGGGT